MVCMCDSRDTIILPCRHLCLCNACADSLRYQANNCPICRAPFRALLQVRILLPLTSELRFRDGYPRSRIKDSNFFYPGTQANNCPICRAPFRALLQEPFYHLPVSCGSGWLCQIQDPNFFHPGSRNPPQQRSHLPRGLSCRYLPLTSVADPGCLSRIRTWIPESRPTTVPFASLPSGLYSRYRYFHLPVSCGSGMVIPDPGSEFFPSRISEHRPTTVPFAARALLQALTSVWESRIRIFSILDPGSKRFRIPDPKDSGSRIQKIPDPGPGSAVKNKYF